jgi:hypothetical protein
MTAIARKRKQLVVVEENVNGYLPSYPIICRSRNVSVAQNCSSFLLGDTINFFVYDVIKIGLLLIVINYFMAVTRYYFPMEKVRDLLTKRRWFGLDYLFAAALGVITPFCSCSSIPLFIGFVGAGIPLGVTFAFLIASPLVNESSLYLFSHVWHAGNHNI